MNKTPLKYTVKQNLLLMLKNLLRYLSFVNILVFSLLSCTDNISEKSQKEHISYQEAKDQLIKTNQKQSFDAEIILTNEELQFEQRLFHLKNQFKLGFNESELSYDKRPFHSVKSFIDSSNLFKVFKKMPKGGLLHSHSSGVTDVKWIINEASKNKNCYVYCQSNSNNFIYGQLAIFDQNFVPKGFVSLKDKINSDPSFSQQLYDLFTLKPKSFSDSLNYWKEFEKCFKRIGKLVTYRPFFKKYYKRAFLDLTKDNIQHVEIRFIFESLYDLEGNIFPKEIIIQDLKEVLLEIQKTNPRFTLSLIYTSFKFLDVETINNQLVEAFRLKKKYPSLITGFDLVAEEDSGNKMSYYHKTWQKLDSLKTVFGVDLPLFIHAGESNSIKNKNLFDAVQLKSKRIGHGLNLVLFPELIEQIKTKNIHIEISPLSNQILGYVNDLRNHPGRILLSNGVQCSISSDDPSVFGYEGLSYDFFSVFLAWELDLKAIKKLVFNSINYASMNDNNKERALKHLEKKWHSFIQINNHGIF